MMNYQTNYPLPKFAPDGWSISSINSANVVFVLMFFELVLYRASLAEDLLWVIEILYRNRCTDFFAWRTTIAKTKNNQCDLVDKQHWSKGNNCFICKNGAVKKAHPSATVLLKYRIVWRTMFALRHEEIMKLFLKRSVLKCGTLKGRPRLNELSSFMHCW